MDKNETRDEREFDSKAQKGKGNRGRKSGGADKRNYPDKRRRPNSADWYYTDTQYRDAVANLPINLITGLPFDVKGLNGTSHNNWEEIPGIMSIDIHESIGPADKMVDPVNQAAYKLWTFIRSKMSGATLIADAQDIMIYVLAVRSLYAWLSSLKKVYGLLSTFEVTNRYLPRYILESEGWDYNDLLQHKPELEAFINVSIDKANNMVLPSTMSIFNRTVFMSESVYMDSTSFRSQIYDFVWDNHYKYVWNGGRNGNGSYLSEVWTPGTRRSTVRTYADIRTVTNTLIDAMFTNEDIGTISGYMLRAFEGNRITLARLDPTYKVNFVYSEEMLSQIQNLRCYGRVVDADISQDPTIDNGTIKTKYVIADNTTQNSFIQRMLTVLYGSVAWGNSSLALIRQYLEEDTMMVFHTNSVTADDWLTSSRLTTNIKFVDRNTAAASTFEIEVGSEYVVDVHIYRLTYAALTGWHIGEVYTNDFSSQDYFLLDDGNMNTTTANVQAILNTITYFAAFRFAPYLRVGSVRLSSGSRSYSPARLSQIDMDVNAQVSDTNLAALHECAILGEFKLA